MSAMTIVVPADQVGPVRESLLARYGEVVEEIERNGDSGREAFNGEAAENPRDRLKGLEAILEQIRWSASAEVDSCSLTGPRPVLWSAVYDTVCVAAERLADLCEAYWKGSIDRTEIRVGISDVAARFDLLESLGPVERGGR